jgi:hypothetical protein
VRYPSDVQSNGTNLDGYEKEGSTVERKCKRDIIASRVNET